MFSFKNSFLLFWKKMSSAASRLASIFGFKRKSKPKEDLPPREPKVPEVPAIKEETAMELSMTPDDHNVGVILDKAADIAKEKKAPEPPHEPLSDEEARNAAKMLPLLLALSMATTGKGEEKDKDKKIGTKKVKGPKVGFAVREQKRRIREKQFRKRSKS